MQIDYAKIDGLETTIHSLGKNSFRSTTMTYLILDTEGKEYLHQIAIIDPTGNLIYEAFTQGHPKTAHIRLKLKPLSQILTEFTAIATGETLICHHAEHDRQVIENSYRHANLPIPYLTYACTWELSLQKFPTLPSYSLPNLCKHFNLKINNKRFDPSQAHNARYDAQFTHQLYLKLQIPMINPFDSSRVDTPFQNHPDFNNIYAQEYRHLKSILQQIQADPNHQSRASVIIGAAGSGKTHLIMRIAQELLGTNRLLFIRQPNNAQTVLYHFYSRILESFAEKVPNTNYTQIELLISNSLTNILSNTPKFLATQKGKDIVNSLNNDPLSLYERLGKEGTEKYRNNWQTIGTQITEWWSNKYANAGNSTNILKGIIRFCRYTDPAKKELTRRWLAAQELEPEAAESIGLPNWQDDMSREEFALEAIAVFGKLSVLDNPPIIVFDQLEGLGQTHNAPILESFGTAIKELLTHVPNSLMILNLFPNRWQQFQTVFDPSITDRLSQNEIQLNRTGETNLDNLFTPTELEDILNQKSIRAILNRASAQYRYKYDHIPLPETITQRREDQLETALFQIFHILQHLFTTPQESTPVIAEPKPQLTTPKPQPSLIPEAITTQQPILPLPVVGTQDPTSITEYLQTKQSELETLYHNPTIINDADDLGKIATILETFNIHFENLPLGRKAIPELLLIPTKKLVIGFLNKSGNSFTIRIKNFNELTVSYSQYHFFLLRDQREPAIISKVAREEIAKLNYSRNGKFQVMQKSDRTQIDLIYDTIIAIQNQDLEVEISTALQAITAQLNTDWLLKSLS
jgi:DNA polymerase III epsilon subunit-like protein/GTPase SAR1 family protein